MSNVTDMYNKLQTREKRVVMRLLRALSSWGPFDDDELTKICRIINRQSNSSKKRKLSGYIVYYTEQYPIVSSKYPEPLGKIAKRIGVNWGKLSDKEQKRYNDRAASGNDTHTKRK